MHIEICEYKEALQGADTAINADGNAKRQNSNNRLTSAERCSANSEASWLSTQTCSTVRQGKDKEALQEADIAIDADVNAKRQNGGNYIRFAEK